MNPSPLIAIFLTVFLAELGDKTQLATILFSTNRAHSPLLVFVIASAALIASTAIAVLLGAYAARTLELIPLKLIAGLCFLLIGGSMIFEHYRAG
jgi:putative Ca2+/H+ antiporter (TMEM165/GDT1 family)